MTHHDETLTLSPSETMATITPSATQPQTLAVPCGDGQTRTVAVRINLQTLAIHPPASGNKRGRWTITHKPTLRACGTFTGTLTNARALATLWDGAFGAIDWQDPTRKPWALTQQWRAQCWGDAPVTGPTLFEQSPNAHPARPETVGMALDAGMACRTLDGDTWEVQWHGHWWPIPTIEELELWTVDSVCERPDGVMIEPDGAGSWLRLLRLV